MFLKWFIVRQIFSLVAVLYYYIKILKSRLIYTYRGCEPRTYRGCAPRTLNLHGYRMAYLKAYLDAEEKSLDVRKAITGGGRL